MEKVNKDESGQRLEEVVHEKEGRKAEHHSEGQRLIRGKAGGEPTGEGGRPEPVERRQLKACVPHALQLGIVRWPPAPRGAGREGSKQEGEAGGRG